MKMHSRSVVVVFLGSAAVGLACSGSGDRDSAFGRSQQANSPEDAGVVDPACSYLTAHVRDDLPTGSCLRGAQCAFSNSPPHCVPGAAFKPAIANEYECSCPDGTWLCEIVKGGLGTVPCSRGPVDEDAGDGG
jgi:hypothetical protein